MSSRKNSTRTTTAEPASEQPKRDGPILITEPDMRRTGEMFGVRVPIDTEYVSTTYAVGRAGGSRVLLSVRIDNTFTGEGNRGPRSVHVTVADYPQQPV